MQVFKKMLEKDHSEQEKSDDQMIDTTCKFPHHTFQFQFEEQGCEFADRYPRTDRQEIDLKIIFLFQGIDNRLLLR